MDEMSEALRVEEFFVSADRSMKLTLFGDGKASLVLENGNEGVGHLGVLEKENDRLIFVGALGKAVFEVRNGNLVLIESDIRGMEK